MRAVIDQLPGSKIREVANAGLGRSDVLAFWFGESDEPTPQFVRDAASDSLARGETFYSHNLGLPELREAVARYTSALHGEVGSDRIAITSSGVMMRRDISLLEMLSSSISTVWYEPSCFRMVCCASMSLTCFARA